MLWHTVTLQEFFEATGTDPENGLSQDEAKLRLVAFGTNQLPSPPVDSPAKIFLRQFQSPLIYILLIAACIVAILGEPIDAVTIFAVLLLNAIIGSIQENHAQTSLSALNTYVTTRATVMREGREMILPDKEVVPGDLLILREGEKIAADSRLVSIHNLKVDQAALTGESGSVHKRLRDDMGLEVNPADRENMVFKGTTVVGGEGRAVAVATGLNTEIGKISQAIAGQSTELPLRVSVERLSNLILKVVVAACVGLFFGGLAIGLPALQIFGVAVSLAVSIIPEGLPVVLTIILTASVSRMAHRHALVKRLAAVEALGQAKIIALDKTGTITRNELVVREVRTANNLFRIRGVGYDRTGGVELDGHMVSPGNHSDLLLTGKLAALSASARVAYAREEQRWIVSGDPTEAALLVFGDKIGFRKDELNRECPLIDEEPFSYEKKYHLTIHEEGKSSLAVVAGAPENIFKKCGSFWLNGKKYPMTPAHLADLNKVLEDFSSRALRVVALAFTTSQKGSSQEISASSDFIFAALVGIEDSPRPEVRTAIEEAREAGFRVVMITGDYRLTALAISRQAGIYKEGDEVLEGSEMDKLSDADLDRCIAGNVTVFSRVTPEHKLRIIESYRRLKERVAMTGDGVNDAPSLVAADLGIAMGQGGTEVAREAADIVLLDNNFETIVAAIEEGRTVYRTVRKVILYLTSTSLAEFATVVLAIALGYPLPFTASQIIWLNLVTDSFQVVALGFEPKEKDILSRKSEEPSPYILDIPQLIRMIVLAVPMTFGSFYLFKETYSIDFVKASTISVTCLAVYQWFNAWNCRSEERSVFLQNPFGNRPLIWATLAVIILQLGAIYWQPLAQILHFAPLEPLEWGVLLVSSLAVIAADELWKVLYRLHLSKREKKATA